MKPIPKAAPINAMPLLRFSLEVQSAITACAVPIVAPQIPAPMRAAKSRKRARCADSAGRVEA